jgi:4-hydroxy-4-methyl-2-oxoglutarate aldolase
MKKAGPSLKLGMERPPKRLVAGLQDLPTTALAQFLTLDAVMRHVIRPQWTPMPRVAGPAYTVRTVKYDNLMLHTAIYHAEPGDVLVVQAGDDRMAVADGHVCAVAQRRGVAGLVVDGVIRDLAESRGRGFPVFARGVSPIPGRQDGPGEIGGPITCGGVRVNPGDVVVADEDGIVVVPRARAETVLKNARARAAQEATESLPEWERKHRARVESTLRAHGYLG